MRWIAIILVVTASAGVIGANQEAPADVNPSSLQMRRALEPPVVDTAAVLNSAEALKGFITGTFEFCEEAVRDWPEDDRKAPDPSQAMGLSLPMPNSWIKRISTLPRRRCGWICPRFAHSERLHSAPLLPD